MAEASLELVDGDGFGKVSKIGRDAAEAVLLDLETGYLDIFCAERCVDLLLSIADAIASVPEVLEPIRRLNDPPLLARMEVDATCVDVSRRGVLRDAMPSLRPRVKEVRKERERDLFAAAG